MTLVAAVGVKGMIKVSGWVLFKEAVPLRMPLYTIPDQLGNWMHLRNAEFEKMSPEMIETLGTKDFIRWRYRNTARPPGEPGSEAILHVAYYTGTPDTVPHVPDRCFLGGGMQGLKISTTHLTFSGPQYSQHDQFWWATRATAPKQVRLPANVAPATIFTFAPGADSASISNVLYFFVANDKFLPSPDLVRFYGFDPRDRYSYYCKVEVLFPGLGGQEEATQKAQEFLSAAMPEILACLPDWQDVIEGRWPVKK